MELVMVGLLTLGAALVILFCPPAHTAFNEMVDQRGREGSANLPDFPHATIADSDSTKRRIRLKTGVAPSGVSRRLRRRD